MELKYNLNIREGKALFSVVRVREIAALFNPACNQSMEISAWKFSYNHNLFHGKTVCGIEYMRWSESDKFDLLVYF